MFLFAIKNEIEDELGSELGNFTSLKEQNRNGGTVTNTV